jgi:Peptidase family M28
MQASLAVIALAGATYAPVYWDQAENELSEEIHTHELQAHVYRLASPDFLGRRGPGAARASSHIAAAFERLKLQPLFDNDSYFQPIPALTPDKETGKPDFLGRNVGAVLPGSDPKLKDEWIILGAHFDHLGQRGDVLYPGADDNATGVAMLLEVAEAFALAKDKPRRTIAFVSFDLEEGGLLGSTHFVNHPPHPIRDVKAFLVADMLGRSMANVMDDYVFVLGSETSPHLRKVVEEMKPEKGLTVGRLGADLIGTRSDYGPFRDRKVPFLFFSTGQHPDYHKPTDTPEKIDYEKVRRISCLMRDTVKRLANDHDVPAWGPKDGLSLDVEEMRTVQVLVQRVLDRPDKFPLSDKSRGLVEDAGKKLTGILKSGQVTTEDRNWLLWTGRLLLATVF